MTLATWPDRLPRPERRTWDRQPADNRLKRNPEAGPTAYRRRSSAVGEPVQLSILVDRELKAEFDRFFRTTIAHGSLPFWMPDPTTDGWTLLDETGVPLLTDADEPLLISEIWLCLWGDQMPQETIEGMEYRMSFGVLVMP